jgi:hypothetical protein
MGRTGLQCPIHTAHESAIHHLRARSPEMVNQARCRSHEVPEEDAIHHRHQGRVRTVNDGSREGDQTPRRRGIRQSP